MQLSSTPTGDAEQPGSWAVGELPVGAGNHCATRAAVQQEQPGMCWSRLSVGCQRALGRSSPCCESVKGDPLWEGFQTRGQNPQAQFGEMAKVELSQTYHPYNQLCRKHSCYSCKGFCLVQCPESLMHSNPLLKSSHFSP